MNSIALTTEERESLMRKGAISRKPYVPTEDSSVLKLRERVRLNMRRYRAANPDKFRKQTREAHRRWYDRNGRKAA